MDKMKLAHEYALEMAKQGIPLKSCKELGWKYADAMQAEAEKRNKAEAQQRRKEIREMLNADNTFVEREGQHFDDVEEWQPDWSQAPNDATAWEYLGHNTARWHTTKNGAFRGADLFGYSGVGMLLVERPEPKFEVDWGQAPNEYPTTGWYIFKGVAHWIADEFPCGPAPSFGFTGTHIVERPHGF